jgi:hypothetical protein
MSYLVVSHGGILNMAMHAILGIAPAPNFQGPHFYFRNTSFARFNYRPDEHNWRLSVSHQRHWETPWRNSNPLRLIFGAGAIGTYIGGSLLLSGRRPSSRAADRDGSRQRRLRLTLDGIRRTVALHCTPGLSQKLSASPI